MEEPGIITKCNNSDVLQLYPFQKWMAWWGFEQLQKYNNYSTTNDYQLTPRTEEFLLKWREEHIFLLQMFTKFEVSDIHECTDNERGKIC